MSAVLIDDALTIPHFDSLADFRQWSVSDSFPDRGRIDFVAGTVEVDMQAEASYSHGSPKAVISAKLADRVCGNDLGEVYISDMRVASGAGGFSVEPDVVVVLHEAFEEGRVTVVPKADRAEDFVEIEGSPDLIVEVVSDSSVGKDNVRLRSAYYAAGVREYWLVDARGADLVFRILERADGDFIEAPADADGFRRSGVLGFRYRLDRSRGRRGQWRFTLREAP